MFTISFISSQVLIVLVKSISATNLQSIIQLITARANLLLKMRTKLKDSLQQHIHFDGNIFGNKSVIVTRVHCRGYYKSVVHIDLLT